MTTPEDGCPSFDSLEQGLLRLLQGKAYGKGTVNNYHRKLRQLERYMVAHDIVTYDPFVGQRFIDDYCSTRGLAAATRQGFQTVLRRLNDFYVGQYHRQRKPDLSPLSPLYSTCMDAYLEQSRETDGNRDATIVGKRYVLREFYGHLESLGCPDLREADFALIGRACLLQNNKDG